MNASRVPRDTPAPVTVVIPARDEVGWIERALRAFSRQTDAGFEVAVFANNCRDETAGAVRAFVRERPRLRVRVFERTLAPGSDHVGTARRQAMDWACDRYLAADAPLGIVATTDADTVVDPQWIETIRDEMSHADAVASFVEIAPAERERMSESLRAVYAMENELRRLWAHLEWLIDPRNEDPAPRHCSFVGAGFAVTARTYVRAGRLPAIRALEDREFLRALRRVDARVRFSLRARAFTSGRTAARAAGGFGTFVEYLRRSASDGTAVVLENPRRIVAELEARRALRAMWDGDESVEWARAVARTYDIDDAAVEAIVDRTRAFGEAWHAIEARGFRERYAEVPLAETLAALRVEIAVRSAASATRSSAASGAG